MSTRQRELLGQVRERALAQMDSALAHAIDESPVWGEQDDLLVSTPGVGPVLITMLLLNLPELGTVTVSRLPRW